MTAPFDEYFAAVSAADAGAAAEVVSAALDRGVSAQRLIREVVVPAQHRTGELWFEGRWTVADEHAATGVTEQAMSVVAPPRARRPGATTVVLACAEGEWHTMPARCAGELARAEGLDVVLLGGSVPSEDLRRHLRATRPAALALSCTLPTNLVGATRSIAAAHDEGVPVVAGGAAWGPDGQRARRLGADRWLADAGGLAAAVADLAGAALARPAAVPAEALLLDEVPDDLLAAVLERQCAAHPWLREMSPYQRTRTLEDLRWLARHAAAAVAVNDPAVVGDLLTWLLALLAPRGVPADAVVDSCYYLADGVEHDAPLGAAVLRAEADRAHERLRVTTGTDG